MRIPSMLKHETFWLLGWATRPTCGGRFDYATCQISACAYHGWIEQGFVSKIKVINMLTNHRLLKEYQNKIS